MLRASHLICASTSPSGAGHRVTRIHCVRPLIKWRVATSYKPRLTVQQVLLISQISQSHHLLVHLALYPTNGCVFHRATHRSELCRSNSCTSLDHAAALLSIGRCTFDRLAK